MFNPSILSMSSASRAEWSANWPIVISAMTGLAACHVHLYSMGVMIGPLEQEFGWSRTQITFGLFLISVVLFPLSPLLGIAIDRFGPRRIALTGMTIYCTAIASLSLAQPQIWIWWLLWLFVASGALFLTPTVWVAAISSRFDKSRGLALALLLSSTGIISFSGPLITYFLIENLGWRMAYMAWAAIAAIVAFPMLYCFFSGAKDNHRVGGNRLRKDVARPFDGDVSSGKGVRSLTFFRLAVAGPVMAVVFTAFIVNIVPLLAFSGIRTATAAAMAGVIGFAQIIGRLSSGYLIDRFDARLIGAVVTLFPVIAAILLIMFSGSVYFAVLALFCFGLAAGAELDVLAYLSSRFFAPGNFGRIFGIIIGMAALGSGIGPIAGNMIYDYSGSYVPLLWAIIPLCLLSSYAFASLDEYRKHENPAIGFKRPHFRY